jgi:hypothetical protein
MNESYKLIKGVFSKDKCLQMARTLEDLMQRGIYRAPDDQCKSSPAFYGIFNNELAEVLPRIQEEISEELLPCYTYARIYQEHEYLKPHFDRPGAEISMTITLDYEKYIWPFCFQKTDGDFEEVLLDIGDALVYKGAEVSHFRHPMIGQSFQHQTFFHYVRKHGNYSHLKFDEREQLLTNLEAEKWNFPEWKDHNFMQDPIATINRVRQGS